MHNYLQFKYNSKLDLMLKYVICKIGAQCVPHFDFMSLHVLFVDIKTFLLSSKMS